MIVLADAGTTVFSGSLLLALPIAVVGCSSLGTKDVPTLLQNEDELTEDFGFGPGPSMVAAIGEAAGWPLIFTKAETGIKQSLIDKYWKGK